MDNIKEITSCRLCGCLDIPVIWDWGNNVLANAFKNKEDLDKIEFEAPLVYFKCSSCHSVQLKYEIDSNILFSNYLYESPPNLIPHFNELAKTTFDYLGLKEGDKVIDIGSNNGLLLQEYKNLGCKVVGFEPCDRIAQKARDRGVGTFSEFFSPLAAENFALNYKSPILCTATNVFAHSSNLNEFVEAIKIILNIDGYFVFENAYLYNTLINKDLGQSYFEHFYLHSVTPLQKLFDEHGFELFKIEYNNVQMGTIRGYVRFKRNQKIQKDSSVSDAIEKEKTFGLSDLEVYEKFIAEVRLASKRLNIILDLEKKRGKTISVYSWPAKMSLINKYFNLEHYLDYVVEEASAKINKFAPGTKLEVKDVEYFKNRPTDVVIVGAYNFFNDIIKKYPEFTGRWINPLSV